MSRLQVAALLAALAVPASAQEIVVKMATLAPTGSSWHQLLRELGERWAATSRGRVKLRIYAGGSQGSEGDVVRKMAVGQLQAAAITNIGMHDIAEEPAVFTTPGLFDGEDEFRAVFSRVSGKLDAILAARGYRVLSWLAVGTAHVFCARPYRTPADMGDAKFFAWEGDPAAAEVFKAVGFRPVVLASVDLIPSLQTGMINCVCQPPAYALTARAFDRASHMVSFPWAFLMGAILVRGEAWERVPAGLRPALAAAARDAGGRLDAESKRLNEDAIAAMVRQGLDVVPVDPGPWRAAAARAWPAVRGKAVPAAFFDEVVRARDEARRAASR